MLLLLGILGGQARDWTPPSDGTYRNNAVVYAALVDAAGNMVQPRGNDNLGAFIGDECRGLTTARKYTPDGTNTTVYVFTLRIGVDSDKDSGKTVNFVLRTGSGHEYQLAETVTVSGADETIGGIPSNPLRLKFVYVTGLQSELADITVLRGEDVARYLPHTFSIQPADATVGQEGISYTVGGIATTGTDVLTQHDDGTITADKAGTARITVTHELLPDKPVTVTVNVVDMPTAADFKIVNNPLKLELQDYYLSKQNIIERLIANISVSGNAPKMPDGYTFSETADDKLLTVYGTKEVIPAKYGKTAVEWTYGVAAAGFEADGSFNAKKERSISFGHELEIIESVSAISANGFTMDVNDPDATIKITTHPEGVLLDESRLSWDIATGQSGARFTIGQRVAGTNEWHVTANDLVTNGLVKVSYTVDDLDGGTTTISDTLSVTAAQHVNLAEGWHWVSLYAGNVPNDRFARVMAQAQEVRSQTELTYNDPKYGFFGSLGQLGVLSGSYKMQVKDGSTLDFYVYDNKVYNGGSGQSVSLPAGWTWMRNPFIFDHDIYELFLDSGLPDNSLVVGKDGFATLSYGKWDGTLTRINAGEGYLIYNAGTERVDVKFKDEASMSRIERTSAATQAASRAAMRRTWTYDARRFADNMSVIATTADPLDADRYTVGAFVGGECRGLGHLVDGRLFITVHGQEGEKVEFRRLDNITGDEIPFDATMGFAATRGTMASPVSIGSPVLTSIDGIDAAADGADVQVFDLSGRRVGTSGLASGVYVVRITTANGIITKKMYKK